MRLAGRVVRKVENRTAYQVLMGNIKDETVTWNT
jgi:hypothetical protein